MERRKPAEREVGDERYAVAAKFIDQGVVASMRQIVVILNANDIAYPPTVRDLRACDIAEPNVTHQPSLLKFGEDRESRLDRSLGRSELIEHHAQVHDV